MDDLRAVAERYRDAPTEPGAERVTLLLQAFPSPERVV